MSYTNLRPPQEIEMRGPGPTADLLLRRDAIVTLIGPGLFASDVKVIRYDG